ncbi:hypothetical protein [Flexilinea flocculi]|uniref:Uncharacterized protein n=1 Tax=Flexilinea flocculi TaxID=1678840 RepID=A0A0S7BWH1_9CHLR|nr:hypothetical protein [Flexilinea flocculi]GAP40920.1 hypothetical protein ATC1_13902 [Flexilinea flocculi]
MARRDAFTGLRDPNPITEVEEDQQQESTMIPRQPLDLIPTADFRKKRSRKWEQVHRLETVTYRGIPQQVVDLIIKDAQSLSVPRDEVIRAFLEHGVRLYRNGEIKLLAYPNAQRMTLYSEGNEGGTILPAQKPTNHKWLADAFPVPEKKAGGAKKKNFRKGQKAVPQWEIRVTFRIPALLKEEVRSIAREHTLPVGEVVCFFVVEGSQAFHNGSLILQPSPKSIGKTLFLE